MTIAAGGTVRTTSGDTADIVENNLTSSGTFNVAANSTVIVDDNWQNSGAVNLNGSPSGAAQIEIEAGKSWTLLDGGAITLNGFNDAILGQGAGAELRNRGNTIKARARSATRICRSKTISGSTIDATVEGSSNTLTLDATAYNPIRFYTTYINNAGYVEASTGATLDVDSAMK